MSRSTFQMAVVVASLAFVAETAHAGSFQQQVAAAPRGEVDVSNISGTIAISGWDQSAVSVTADLPSDTQRVKVTTGNGRTSVCVIYNQSDSCNSPGGFSQGGGAVRLEIRVPRGSELDVSGVNADIRSDGVSGTQHLHTVNGGIDAQLGSGTDEVTSVSGTIVLRGSGQDGALHVTSVSGDLNVTNVAGELEARTVNGTLIAGLTTARLVRLNTTSGDIQLSGQLSRGGTVETESVSGDEQIRLSAPAGYAYEAKTFSGDIKNCFGQQSERSEFGPGDRLNGTRAAGDGHVRMQSLSGNISLCDH
jgi:hypothetical protein